MLLCLLGLLGGFGGFGRGWVGRGSVVVLVVGRFLCRLRGWEGWRGEWGG